MNDTFTQRRTSTAAAGIQKPAGVHSSVFEAGRAAKVVRPRLAFDPEHVLIRKEVPIPPSIGKRTDPYGELLRRMEPGDMVELESRIANSLFKRAKVLGIKVTKRALSPGRDGIWRLQDDAE